MTVHIIDFQSDDINNEFVITIYGKTPNNNNIVCHVTDFKPRFYVKIPTTWNLNTFSSKILNELTYSPFKSKIVKKLKNDKYYTCQISVLK